MKISFHLPLKLVDWYRNSIRPFLKKTESTRIPEFDEESDRILRIEETLERELPVCFLGNSGIGKSTLINALVAGKEIILPSGGIGPLTAQALSVCYGETASFEAFRCPVPEPATSL